MCWVTKYTPVKIIAKEDIPVQKLVDRHLGKCKSYFFRFIWEINKCYETELEEPQKSETTGNYVINKGFHSVRKIEIVDTTIYSISSSNVYSISSSNKRRLLAYDPWTVGSVVNAIIPKGSTYYKNEHDEYVSNQLILL